MNKIEAADPQAQSADLVADNIAKLKALFPELITEGAGGAAVNVDVLKQLVGDATVSDAEEKYGLNWHGKRRARQLALTPSTGTLRPCPEDSVDWHTTQNLMIEGDNLEVLKLLQKSYAGKVKLIYIDPPYNTGKDFVYPDNFQDSIRNYLELTGQVEGGARVSSNTEASGRFHTDWLNMIYPRIRLSRDLLRNDGIILISIDDSELSNLQAVCSDVFGQENFVATFIWEKRTSRENRKVFSTNHDYIVAYAKNADEFQKVRGLLPFTDAALERYSNPDNDPRGKWQSVSLSVQGGHGTASQFYEITTPSGRKVSPPSGLCWRYTSERLAGLISEGRIWFGPQGNNVPRLKLYLTDAADGLTPHTLWKADEVGTTDTGKRELLSIFDGEAAFDTVKPTSLLQRIIQIATCRDEGEIVLDFFAGSGSTAHAAMLENAADDGLRKWILVQLPEPLDPEDRDQQIAAKYCDELGKPRNIAELTKERLRRAGKKIKSENSEWHGDTGFRVYKLDQSNIRAWQPSDNLKQDLVDSVEHIIPGRDEQDVLTELLLKLGLDLCVPIEQRQIAGRTVHAIGGGVLLACLDPRIGKADAEPLALGITEWHLQLAPAGDTTCVFRDSAFENDEAKTNVAAILEQHGIRHIRSL